MTDSDITFYDYPVPRWKPEAQVRLMTAALELFESHGFDGTTVAMIAERSQLTERTFYRYFDDKREVLFGGTPYLDELIAERIASVAPTTPPVEIVVEALKDFSSMLEEQRDFTLRRAAVIAANSELRERELVKMSHLVERAAHALVERGVPDAEARAAAELGAVIFKLSFDRWSHGNGTDSLGSLLDASYATVRRVSSSQKSSA